MPNVLAGMRDLRRNRVLVFLNASQLGISQCSIDGGVDVYLLLLHFCPNFLLVRSQASLG